jgi:hypothetical protein
MMEFLLAVGSLYLVVSIAVFLAMIGHMWGSSKRWHLVDILVFSFFCGLLWPIVIQLLGEMSNEP